MRYLIGHHRGVMRANSLLEALSIYAGHKPTEGKVYIKNEAENTIVLNTYGWDNNPSDNDKRELERLTRLQLT